MKSNTLFRSPAAAEGSAPKAAEAAAPGGNLSTADLAKRLRPNPAASPTAKPEGAQQAAPEGEAAPNEGTPEVTPPAAGAEGAATAEGEPAAPEGEQPEGVGEATETPEQAEPAEGDPNAEQHAERAQLVTDIIEAIKAVGGDPKLVNKKLVTRIHSIADQRDTERNERLRLAEQNQQLAEQLKQAAQTPGVPQMNGATFHPDIAKLDANINAAQQVIEWAESNPDGAEVPDGKGGTLSYDAAQVRQFKAKATADMARLSASRESKAQQIQQDYNAKRSEAVKTAQARFPWTKQQNSPEYQEVVSLIRDVPELQLRPDWPLLTAYMVEGRKAIEAKGKTPMKTVGAPLTGKPPGSRVPPAVVAAPASGAPKVDAAQAEVKRLEKEFKDSGGKQEVYAKLLAARTRAKAARS